MKKYISIILVCCIIVLSCGVVMAEKISVEPVYTAILDENFNDNTGDRVINMFEKGTKGVVEWLEEGDVSLKSTSGSSVINYADAKVLSDFRLTVDVTIKDTNGHGIVIRGGSKNQREDCYFLQWYSSNFRVLKYVGSGNSSTSTALSGTLTSTWTDYTDVKQSVKIEANGSNVEVWLAKYDGNNLSEYIKVLDFTDTSETKYLCGYIDFFVQGTENPIVLNNAKIELPGEIVYNADFSDGVPSELSNCVYGTQNLSASEEVLTVGGNIWSTTVLSDEKYSEFTAADAQYDNYTIEAVVSTSAGSTLPGIAFRGTNGNVYSVYVRNDSGNNRAVANLMKITNGSTSGGTKIDATNEAVTDVTQYIGENQAPVFSQNENNLFKVKVTNTEVKAWFNGYQILDCSAENGLLYTAIDLAKGSVGVMNTTGNGYGFVHSLRVYAQEGDVLSSSLMDGARNVPVNLEYISFKLVKSTGDSQGITVNENGVALEENTDYTLIKDGANVKVKFNRALKPISNYAIYIPRCNYVHIFTTGGELMGDLKYSNDFSGSVDLENLTGSPVIVEDGVVKVSGSGWATSYIGESVTALKSGKAYDNYMITVDFTPSVVNAAASAALAFRTAGEVDGQNDTYSVYIRNKNYSGELGNRTGMVLMSIKDGSSSGGTIKCYENGDEETAKYTIPAIDAGRTYNLMVVVNGSRVRGYLDGNLMLDHTVTDKIFKTGGIGFMAGNNAAQFDNLKVYSLKNFCVANKTGNKVTVENLTAEDVNVIGYYAGFSDNTLDSVSLTESITLPVSGSADVDFTSAAMNSSRLKKILIWEANSFRPLIKAIYAE